MADKLNHIIFTGGFSYPYGMAATKRVQHFIDYFKDKGFRVSVLLTKVNKKKSSKNNTYGLYKNISYKSYNLNMEFKLRVILLFPCFVMKPLYELVKFKKNRTNNCLYVYDGINIENIIFVLFAKIIGYKIIVDIVEDYRYIEDKMSAVHKVKIKSQIYIERFITFFADGIVVISSCLKNKYQKLTQNKIPVVLIPVSAKISNEKKDKSFHSPIRIAYSGSFGKKDGLEYLIRAFNKISQKDKRCVLLLSGKGSNADDILKNVKNPNIKYVGYLDDQRFYEFLQESDILCMTRIKSKYANAGFPFKLGEYLATGKPVIVSKVSDVECYLKDKKDAVLIEPEDSEQIISAIEYLIENPKRASEIGENGKKVCKEFFHPQVNGRLLENLINGI